MTEVLKTFTIKDIDLFRDDENVDFAIAEVYFISDGNNAQNCPISTETLKRDSNTALGKPLVAKYHRERRDVGSHELEEVIVGWIPESSTIEFKEKDGKLFAVAKAVVSKIYATEVYQLFLDSNERAVSCEFSAYQPNADYLGEGEIEGFVIRGITLLGKSVRPCVDGADIKLIKFSEKEADEFYVSSTSNNILKNFADERKSKLDNGKYVNNPMDKSKESIDESSWDGDKAKHDLIKEKNYKTLAKSVCLDLEDGWEDRQVTALKYPVMNLKDGKWVYNKEGLNSAQSYSAQHDPEVNKKVLSIKKKLGLIDDKDKEEKMAETKEFAVEIGNLWGLIYGCLETKYPDSNYGSIYRIYGIYEEGSQKFAVIYRRDESNKYRLDFNISETGIEMGEDIIEVKENFEEIGEVKRFSEDGEDKFKKFEEQEIIMEEEKKEDLEEDKKEPEEEKKFSLDAYADCGATLAFLENETEQHKALAEKVMKEMSAEDIVKTIVEFAKEVEGLKKFKEEVEEQEKQKKFNSIMASVKGDLDEKTFSDLYKEGEGISLNDMSGFENKVKAFAYEATKKKTVEETDIAELKFAVDGLNKTKDDGDVFAKIANK